MLKVYNTKIKEVYVGNIAISKAYTGSTTVFNAITFYTVTLNIDSAQSAWGTVTGGGIFAEGIAITVKATPASGYEFKAWQENGSNVSTNATYSFTVSKDRILKAIFAKASRLPSGYKEVEYLNFGGKTRIDSAMYNSWEASYKNEIVMQISDIPDGSKPLIGQQGMIRSSSKTYSYNHSLYYDGTNMNLKSKYATYSGSTQDTAGVNLPAVKSSKMTIVVDGPNKTWSVNGNSIAFTPTAGVYSNGPVVLGGYSIAIKNAANTGTVQKGYGSSNVPFRLYSVKMWDKNGVLKKNLVPCIRTSDSVPGVYDLVNSAFFGEATHTVTEGVITPGPEV